jgi:hypothetical protein
MYTKIIGALALSLTATLASAACVTGVAGCGGPPSLRAPEIDPASAVAAMTLLLGGIAVMRGRKKK